jgi:hypothetical protein
MRRKLMILALSVLTVGCTVTTGGAPVPAKTLGHAPAPLSASALAGLLLSADELDTLMDASSLKLVHTGRKMYTNHTPDDECLVGWINVHKKVYADTGWTAMRRQELHEPGEHYSHVAFQAVVAFPEAIDAHDFYAEQVTSWSECGNRTVNERNLGDPDNDNDSYWSLAEANETDGVLTISRVAEGGSGASCQRALTAQNNVVIDIDACAFEGVTNEGAEIAKAIAAKVSAQE